MCLQQQNLLKQIKILVMFKHSKHKFINKATIAIIAFTGMLLLPNLLFAQGNEGCGVGQDPTDPYTTCPLDTWVWVLVIGAVIFGAVKLNQKRKVASAV
jgi:hypothetical protein